MATVSKDLTWKLWNTKIDYERGQEAELLVTGRLSNEGHSLVALSPDAYTVAVVTDKKLSFFSALTAKCDEVVDNICNGKLNLVLVLQGFLSTLKIDIAEIN